MKRNKKLSKKLIAAIVVACVAIVAAAAILITNAFIPVKYLSAYFVSVNKNPQGEMRVTFLDIGHGDCTLVEFPDGKTLLIDGGNGRYGNRLKLLTLLNSCGIDTIDYLVCTSVRGECCGGLAEVLKYKQVNTVYMPYCINTYITDEYRAFCEAARETERQNGTTVKYCEYGEGEFTDDYLFCFLSPSAHDNPKGEYAALNASPSTTNILNASAVMWIECGGTSFLLLGNVLTAVQDKLYKEYNLNGGLDIGGRIIDIKKCNVIKVANHGDAASECSQLYDLTVPEAAIISVGENGRNCPSVEVMSNVLSHGTELYRTDYDGTVTVKVAGGQFVIDKEKK